MFPNDSDLRMEPGFDWTLLGENNLLKINKNKNCI